MQQSQSSIVNHYYKIDGVTPVDICLEVERCKELNCRKYHPMWLTGACILFILGYCQSRRCYYHYNWEEYRKYAVPGACFDIFSIKLPKGGGVSTELKLSTEEFQNLSSLTQTLGSNKFFQGDKPSHEDEQILKQVDPIGPYLMNNNFQAFTNLRKWYQQMKEQTKQQFSRCDMCKNSFFYYSMLEAILQNINNEVPKTCINCLNKVKQMKEYDDLLAVRPYIRGEALTYAEIDVFKYLNTVRAYLLASPFQNLVQWFFRMNDLLVYQYGVCKGCGIQPAMYCDFNNLIRKLKKGTIFCQKCLQCYATIDQYIGILGNKSKFFGFKGGAINKEIGVYQMLKQNYLYQFLEDIDSPIFEKWVEKIVKFAEISIVQCSQCQKQMKGLIQFKMTKGDLEGYVCGLICRMNFFHKATEEQKKKQRRERLDKLKIKYSSKVAKKNNEEGNEEEEEELEMSTDEDEYDSEKVQEIKDELKNKLEEGDYNMFQANIVNIIIDGHGDDIDEILRLLKKNKNDAFDTVMEMKDGLEYDYVMKKYPKRF